MEETTKRNTKVWIVVDGVGAVIATDLTHNAAKKLAGMSEDGAYIAKREG